MGKKFKRALAAAAFLGAAAYGGGCEMLFRLAVTRESLNLHGPLARFSGKSKDEKETDYSRGKKMGVAWCEAQPMKDVWITADDGVRLHAKFFPAGAGDGATERTPKRAVLCAHGYRVSGFWDFGGQVRWLHRIGCDVLLIDERGTNQSGGDYITYGALEKRDIARWAVWLDSHEGGKLPIYLFGVSLGCASVELATALPLPSSVKGVIADCGYSSVRDIFADQARRVLHLPPYPLLWIEELNCRLRAGFSFADADVAAALERNENIPVLFIHGTADQFVLPENGERNYVACSAPKRIVWVQGAGHAASYLTDKELYESSGEQFFEEVENGTFR
ncbi:MAG: alpha/beta hydrolase [Lachnospiraceae bacterium]|jgi:fermentation-respiration switch protein FrsA (DUF1100 family)